MRTVNLASGSKGNSTYFESNEAKILVDEGLTYTNIKDRLAQIGVLPEEIDAILLTHEHTDHLGGIATFLKKNPHTKVYIPSFVQALYLSGIMALPQNQIEWYRTSDFFIKDVTVSCAILPHDSNFCVGYSLYFGGVKCSIATDLGEIKKDIIDFLAGSTVLYLESNHDEHLLMQNPKYPPITKKRILGSHGHLSNTTCAYALCKLVPTGVKQVVLAHLSEENNTPVLAYTTIKRILGENNIVEGKHVCVDVAFQSKVGTIFNL